MGKANRKLRKKQERQENAARQEENSLWETTLQEQMEEGQYDKAIETLAELVKGNDLQPKFMYDAAYCYFMCGDYERSASWINNTLTYEPNHIGARILLARLMILKERVDDGLAIFDFVLDKFENDLTEEQEEEIEDIVEFYGRNDRGRILRDFPHIAEFLDLEAEQQADTVKTEGPRDILERLRQRVAQAEEPVKEATAVITKKADEVTKKPAELLSALKQKLAGSAMSTSADTTKEKIATASADETTGGKTSSATDEEVMAAAEKARQEILAKDAFPAEKALLLNSFAAAYYYQRQPAAALMLLKEALRQDAPTDELLRNLVLVELDLGNKETAMQCAARMRVADFALLRLLREET